MDKEDVGMWYPNYQQKNHIQCQTCTENVSRNALRHTAGNCNVEKVRGICLGKIANLRGGKGGGWAQWTKTSRSRLPGFTA